MVPEIRTWTSLRDDILPSARSKTIRKKMGKKCKATVFRQWAIAFTVPEKKETKEVSPVIPNISAQRHLLDLAKFQENPRRASGLHELRRQ